MFITTAHDLLRISLPTGTVARGYIERPAVTLYDRLCTLDDIAGCEAALATTIDPVSIDYLTSELADMRDELAAIG